LKYKAKSLSNLIFDCFQKNCLQVLHNFIWHSWTTVSDLSFIFQAWRNWVLGGIIFYYSYWDRKIFNFSIVCNFSSCS